MRAEPACPRCAGPLRPPRDGDDWTCSVHGVVLPLRPPLPPDPGGLDAARRDSRVPVWIPWPLPADWFVTGFAVAGDDGTDARASAVALHGPGLLNGGHDLVIVSEEPGVGLGAAFAGLDGPDPGVGVDRGIAHAKLDISGPSATAGRTAALWSVPVGPDRAAYVGEALGDWLWLVMWPAEAGMLVLETTGLLDLREPGMDLDLPYGSPSGRLF